jgi:hypothetical protein
VAETPETPTPSLAERIDVFLAAPGVSDATSDDLLRAAAALLRHLDRIKAALGDVDLSQGFFLSRHADACSYCSSGIACETADLIEAIADALEADDGA